MLKSPFALAASAMLILPDIGSARDVVIQQFDPGIRSPNRFVLVAAQPSATTHLPDRKSDPTLATDFYDLAGTEIQIPRASSANQPKLQLANMSFGWDGLPPSCGIPSYIANPALSLQAEQRRATWYAVMAQAACDAGVPVPLFDSLITAESRYNPAALSPKGAAGLAQLMPGAARAQGVGNVWNPAENLSGGARLLRNLLDEFGRFDLALAAYNAGPGRVRATRQVPRIPETVQYVSRILVTMRDQLLRKRTELP